MHVHAFKSDTVLKYSIVLMFAFALAEAVAGLAAHSLALVSDGGHNLADSLTLVLTLYAFYLQNRPADNVKTYGYHRAGVLAAFANSVVLIVIALYIFYEAYSRLRHPTAVETGWMMAVAGVGFLVNTGVAMALLGGRSDVNIRSAFLHTAGDAASTAAIVVGGFAIRETGIVEIDPLLSVVIGGLLLWNSVDIIRETLNILLEGLPKGLTLEEVVAAIGSVDGVLDVHDMHIWSLGSSNRALSSHVTIADIPPSESGEILKRINEVLENEFKIRHTTIQFEHAVCDPSPTCCVPVPEAAQRLQKRI
jgi:cobalt-zinc-cadmium efflux system protein